MQECKHRDKLLDRKEQGYKHLDGLLEIKEQDNAWLQRDARQIREGIDEKVAQSLADQYQTHSKEVLAMEAKFEALQSKARIREKICG